MLGDERTKILTDFFYPKEQSPTQAANNALESLKKPSLVDVTWKGKTVTPIVRTLTEGIALGVTAAACTAVISPLLGAYSVHGGMLLTGAVKVCADDLYHRWVVLPKLEAIEHLRRQQGNNMASAKPHKKVNLDMLDQLPGLGNIKRQIASIATKLIMDRKRVESGLSVHKNTLHMCFEGNSGTGKTLSAQCLASIFHDMEIIRENRCLITDARSFYTSSTDVSEHRIKETLKEASGGILFVDANNTMATQDVNSNGKQNNSGIKKLLTQLKEYEGDSIVIISGNQQVMATLRSSNPDLSSTIPHTISFKDYTSKQLTDIFKYLCTNSHYSLSDLTYKYANDTLGNLKEKMGDSFANGRTVKTFFEEAITAQSERLINESELFHDARHKLGNKRTLRDYSDHLSPRKRRRLESNKDHGRVNQGREVQPSLTKEELKELKTIDLKFASDKIIGCLDKAHSELTVARPQRDQEQMLCDES